MKIYHVIAAAIAGGAENLVKDLAIKQVENGEDVCVVFLSSAEEVSRCQGYEYDFLKELSCNNVESLFLGENIRVRPWKGAIAIIKNLKGYKGDVVIHCHLLHAIIIASLVFKRNLKVVYTHHSMSLKLPLFFYRLLNFRINEYIGICKACAGILEVATGRDVKVIPNAVNKNKLIPKSSNGASDALKVMMVGSFRSEKNYISLVKAIKLIQTANITIDIYGEGEKKHEVALLIEQLNLGGKVLLKGNHSNLGVVYQYYDLFLMSSSSEGLPIALIEASLSNVPVLVSDVGGCREVVDYFNNGEVYTDISPKGIAAAIDTYCQRKKSLLPLYCHTMENCIYDISLSAICHSTLYKAI
jgi:glycosyltransferase involved in cell wall biosynthesis